MSRWRIRLFNTPELRFAHSVGWLLPFALLGTVSLPAISQHTSADEYDIRAAILVNLTKFIEWPAWKVDASHPQFVICILGPDPIAPAADRYLRNATVGGKPVQVRHLNSEEGANSCHILYADQGEIKKITGAVPELMKQGVLIISERPNTGTPDQVVGLPAIDEHIRIDINLGAARKTGLSISSRLLGLANVNH